MPARHDIFFGTAGGNLHIGIATMITSPQNPQIKSIIKLRKKRERDEQGLMIIEGAREVGRAIQAELSIDTIYLRPELFSAEAKKLPQQLSTFNFEPLTSSVFKKISYRDTPDGVLAVAHIPDRSLNNFILPHFSHPNNPTDPKDPTHPHPLLLIAEHLEKPGNLGAMLRTADAAGITGVLICDPQVDVWNPNVIRASRGAVFTVPFATCTTEECLEFLKKHAIVPICTSPSAAKEYTETDFKRPSAIVIGSEEKGLSDTWLSSGSELVKIPMHGKIDSLNASVSAAILVYEALRQRKNRQDTELLN